VYSLEALAASGKGRWEQDGNILPLSEIRKQPGFAPILEEAEKRVQPPKK
jgi:hypothetical protein